jgi:predicted dehydrogenase
MADAVRWGILGVGDVCEVKSGPALQDAEGSELVAVMRRTAGAAEDFATRHGVPAWFDDAEALVNSADVSAIYVASPPGAHLEHAKLACATGKPTYIEKPLGRNVAETKEIVDMFEVAGVPLFVAYYRRGLAPFTVAREMLASGAIGAPVSVSFRLDQQPNAAANAQAGAWRVSPAAAGGGLFCDTGVHAVDIIEYTMGEPLVGVSGSAANIGSPWQDVEDTVSMSFSFEGSGARGVGLWSFCAPTSHESLVIDCTKGRITLVVSGMKGEVQRVDEDGTLGPPTPLESRGNIADVQRGVQQGLVQQIVDELRGVDGAACPSKGDNAMRVASVVDTVLGSYYGGREDSFWERDASTYPGKASSEAAAAATSTL